MNAAGLTPRLAVSLFALTMEQGLRKNDYKGGWLDCELEYLRDKLTEEKRELIQAVKKHEDNYYSANQSIDMSLMQRVIDEAADVANIAMMIADVVRYKCR